MRVPAARRRASRGGFWIGPYQGKRQEPPAGGKPPRAVFSWLKYICNEFYLGCAFWVAHFSPHRDDPAAWDPVSKTGGMTVRLCPSLRAPPPGERARALTIPQREHHAEQAGTRTQRHALVRPANLGCPVEIRGTPRQRGCNSDGRALRSHRRGRGFKPRQFHLRQRMVSRGRVEAVPVIWLLVVRLHDRPGCLGADRLAFTHSPLCPSWSAARSG